MNARESELRERFERAGQGHVLAHWETLTAQQRVRLIEQLAATDLEQVTEQARLLRASHGPAHAPALAPPELFPLRRDASHERQAEAARRAGEALLREGKVGYLLVAGGQASRLGFDGPKGAFAIGPVSGRSLFEMHARRLLAARLRYGAAVPWYVMTSPANHDETRGFFERHRHFGLPSSDVIFFSQAAIPAMDPEGRLLLSAPDSLFLAPNGHGGTLLALEQSGALANARERGLTQLSYFQVDNPLARPADPLFLGLHALAGAGMSSKVVAKRDAHEKVGVIAKLDGRLGCVEYSDMPTELCEQRDAQGELLFRAGNIAIHVLRVDFVGELTRGGLQLPWHLARKQMKVFADGAMVEKQGIKFETFVFDALAHTEHSVTLEVDRRLEFSPVKNKGGEDSPDTARADLCRLHGEWVRAAGLPLPPKNERGLHPVEVDPLIAEDQAAFVAAQRHEPQRSERGHHYTHEPH